jgi:transcriptional regulator
MYAPAAFAEHDRGEILRLVRRISFGHLVTAGGRVGGRPTLGSTALPFVVDDGLTTARAHIARANDQWRSIDGGEALLIVSGVDAYVSPRWYPSKAEHGRVVPTWNYEVVHLHGTVRVRHDTEWKLALVEELTDLNEQRVSRATAPSHPAPPWRVHDAPRDFIDGMLNAIVGLQLDVIGVEASRKLSQNRSEADRLGATAGLAESAEPRDREVAARMGRPVPGRGHRPPADTGRPPSRNHSTLG